MLRFIREKVSQVAESVSSGLRRVFVGAPEAAEPEEVGIQSEEEASYEEVDLFHPVDEAAPAPNEFSEYYEEEESDGFSYTDWYKEDVGGEFKEFEKVVFEMSKTFDFEEDLKAAREEKKALFAPYEKSDDDYDDYDYYTLDDTDWGAEEENEEYEKMVYETEWMRGSFISPLDATEYAAEIPFPTVLLVKLDGQWYELQEDEFDFYAEEEIVVYIVYDPD